MVLTKLWVNFLAKYPRFRRTRHFLENFRIIDLSQSYVIESFEWHRSTQTSQSVRRYMKCFNHMETRLKYMILVKQESWSLSGNVWFAMFSNGLEDIFPNQIRGLLWDRSETGPVLCYSLHEQNRGSSAFTTVSSALRVHRWLLRNHVYIVRNGRVFQNSNEQTQYMKLPRETLIIVGYPTLLQTWRHPKF